MNSPKRILLYACGGGIGHFNRAYALGRELLKRGHQPLLLASTPLAPPLAEELSVLRCPPLGFAPYNVELLKQIVTELQAKILVVDTFPQGIQNELDAFQERVQYKILISRDFLPSKATAHFQAVVHPYPEGVGYFLNRQPPELWERSQARRLLRAEGHQPVVLVAHNGEPAETQGLFTLFIQALKDSPYTLRLASLLPLQNPEFAPHLISYFPLSTLYRGVDLLIGGGGYNLVAEAQAHGLRRLYCPFERPIDNQFERVKAWESFALHISPRALREKIERCLDLPAPPALPLRQCQGAQKVADRIEALL